ncbi:N-acetylglucosaminyl transferase component family protein / Gpi1 family protein isoform X2 [Tasmannia lanceolata]|uniref:N-acetylglucosaminyl transferase component family protein / Gpi1 family protein isoform X2 n=1 Tax=Tasmannia lanceolata TaxID=3420 RepID=UPI004062A3EA
MMKGKCRIWWPKHLLSREPNSTLLLFGWCIRPSHASVDIVVAIAAPLDHISLPLFQSDLQGILHYTHGKMPIFLQDHSTFSILGHCAADCSCESWKMDSQSNGLVSETLNQRLPSIGIEEVASTKATYYGGINPQHGQKLFGGAASAKNCRKCNCSCLKLDGFLEADGQSSIRTGNWIHLIPESPGFVSKEIRWLPRLNHMHCDGWQFSIFDVHVIIYEQPTFGVHHFSFISWNSSQQVETPFKRPKWIDELHQKQPLSDLDTVFLALNSATAAKIFFEKHTVPKSSYQFRAISMLSAMIWHALAMFVASFFTLFYIILQFCYRLLSYGSESFVYMMLTKIFIHTWKNVRIRICQILYWPIFLKSSSFRSESSVEYAHKAALAKHSIWSSIVVDVLLGNIVGLTLLVHAEVVCLWVLHLAGDITNSLLRSGCVWLMGVPAGFKLNTELAEILGMMSLNAIQIWSTLWFFMGSLFQYFIEGLALSGIILGVTIPAALCIDLLKLGTLHLSALHWLISLLYSLQIQALASLWRLFRGRKWNPLRQRLDSYDYSVGQHVVGSLLFTPLLLLLPTTSVFYIFFTIMNATIRFPSGIWFKIISGQSSNMPAYAEHGILNERYSQSNSQERRKTDHKNNEGPGTVVSILCSNFASIGQIVLPHYKKVFHEVSLTSGATSAYGVLSGRSIPSSLQTGLPSTLPWFYISFREYWRLCHNSVLACR